jgi:peptidoglycan pentaglycine glycine transferase (the first glycine)
MELISLDKNQLEAFVASQAQAQFLQGWDWGEFNRGLGQTVEHWGVRDNGQLLGAVSLIKKVLPLGLTYFYSPRGPIIVDNNQAVFNFLQAEVKKIAKQEKIIFWRLEPVHILADRRLIRTLDIQPSQTLLIDLRQSREEILAAMHQKTRYNLRLAQKKGVAVKHGLAAKPEAADWWRLLSATAARDKFKLHRRAYYESLLTLPGAELWQARFAGELLAAAIIVSYGDTVTYVHGASAGNNRQVMAPYLLHWEIINWAKRAGYHYYDFYGVDERRWPGVSRFKLGFGGQIVKYSGTFDLVFNSLYYRIYQVLRKIRRVF